EAQSEKSSVQVVPMAEALSDASSTAKPQAADETVRAQDPAPVVSQEPDEAATAKNAKRQESARSRRDREARAERRKSAKALARARQRDLDAREETFTASGAQSPFGETDWQQGGAWNAETRSVFGQESSASERAPASSGRQRAERRSRYATRHGYAQSYSEQEYRQAVAPERTNRLSMEDRPFGFNRGGPGRFVDADAGQWRGNWGFGR